MWDPAEAPKPAQHLYFCAPLFLYFYPPRTSTCSSDRAAAGSEPCVGSVVSAGCVPASPAVLQPLVKAQSLSETPFSSLIWWVGSCDHTGSSPALLRDEQEAQEGWKVMGAACPRLDVSPAHQHSSAEGPWTCGELSLPNGDFRAEP